MDLILSDKQKTLLGQKPVVTLSLIALVCTVLSNVGSVIMYAQVPFTTLLEFFIALIIDLTPSISLALYALKFHKTLKTRLFFSLILDPLVLSALLVVLSLFSFLNYEYSGFNPFAIYYIFYFILFITYSVVKVSALKGFNKKTVPILMLGISICGELYNSVYVLGFTSTSSYYAQYNLDFVFVGSTLADCIGKLSLLTALIVFILKNRIPAVVFTFPNKGKQRVEEMSPEKALMLLKDKLDLGIITEEEYQAQRAEIINKL